MKANTDWKKRMYIPLPKQDQEPDGLEVLAGIINAAIIITLLLVLLAWMQYRDDEAEKQVEYHKASAQRYSGMLAECLNGNALIDKTSGKAFFCGKAIELSL